MSHKSTPEPEEPIQYDDIMQDTGQEGNDMYGQHNSNMVEQPATLALSLLQSMFSTKSQVSKEGKKKNEWEAFKQESQLHDLACTLETSDEDEVVRKSNEPVNKKSKIEGAVMDRRKVSKVRTNDRKKVKRSSQNNDAKKIMKPSQKADNVEKKVLVAARQERKDVTINTDTVPETLLEEIADTSVHTTVGPIDLEGLERSLQDEVNGQEGAADHIERANTSIVADISHDGEGIPRIKAPLDSSTPKRPSMYDVENEPELMDEEQIEEDVMQLPNHPLVGEEPKKKQKAVRRSKKRIINEGSDDEEQRRLGAIESDIHELIQARMFTDIRADSEHISSLIAKQRSITTNKYTSMLHKRHNDMVEDAAEELRRVAEIYNRPGVAGNKKKEAKAAEMAQEYADRVERCINSVTETPISVHVDDIEWDENLHKTNKLTVSSIMKSILAGRKNILHLVVRGYNHLSEETGRIMTYIHQGPEIVLAYRNLAKMVNECHKDEYETLEETQHPKLTMSDKNMPPRDDAVLSMTSQPVVGNDREAGTNVRLTSSQVETVKKKLGNPFAYVLVQVLDCNMVDIDDRNISLVKTMQKDDVQSKEMTNRIKMIYMRDVLKTRKLDLKDHTQKFINDRLKACLNYYNPTLARSVRLPDDVFGRLTDVMASDAAYENVDFVRTFMNARNICSVTADKVLICILADTEPRVKPEDAIDKLRKHPLMVMYVLKGKRVRTADATLIGESLEQSKHTVKAIKAMVGKGMKLKEEKLQAIKYKPEPILEIIARELDPCIAFTKASVIRRMRNDGDGRQHCILAFITFEDLKKECGNDAFLVPLKKYKEKDSPTFLFVVDHDADSTHVTELFPDIRGLGATKKHVECVPYKKDGEMVNLVDCIIIGGVCGKGWSSEDLRGELAKFDCKSSIENFTMRKIMFNAYKTSDKIVKCNNVNSVFVHSPKSAAILGIVSNMAPYRVITSASGNELEVFKTDLWRMQKSRADTGTTFPAKKGKAKRDAEDEDDDTYDCDTADESVAGAVGEEEEVRADGDVVDMEDME